MRADTSVRIWEETVVIPTYQAGEPEKSPLFIEKRAYQGSTGKVYPLPVTETISNEKTDVEYRAVFLENEYLKIMVLPELGGRIQRAYDKTNGYDFVYYNHVIRPALVGLAGPWISGGIEFNWPQHHRPSTFSPVDYTIEENRDGSCTVYLGETDRMYGTKGMAAVSLYPGKAYIEVRGQLYNGTDLPQTFLWWANPAVPVNDDTYSVFPPDVNAVMDHGKRAVSTFPIATGEYYKWDYSAGVDISRYKNVKVPTSYMAAHSDFDFIGNYDEGREAGLLHVADHHISPGKKQWTWGNGDFGRMWDRNLTETDGPYIELMTGVFTDNQPDFSWLKPQEEKTFVQYFMPYKGVGRVENATKDAVIGLTWEKAETPPRSARRQDDPPMQIRCVKGGTVETPPRSARRQDDPPMQIRYAKGGSKEASAETMPETMTWKVYATGEYPGAEIILFKKEEEVCRQKADLSPKACVAGVFTIPLEGQSCQCPPIKDCEQNLEREDPTRIEECSYPPIKDCEQNLEREDPTRIEENLHPAISDCGYSPAREDAAARKGNTLRPDAPWDYRVEVRWKDRTLVSCSPYKKELAPIPQPAEALKKPEELKSLEELYLAATHLEQYRHATREPAEYYLEGLRRDPTDIRLNNGYGLLLLRRGQIRESIPYFQAAIRKQTWRNPNPYSGECYFNLGLAFALAGQRQDAYDAFYKSTWSAEIQSAGFYWLACLTACEGRQYAESRYEADEISAGTRAELWSAPENTAYGQALEFAEKSLVRNWHNMNARMLKAALLRRMGEPSEAFLRECLGIDPLHMGCLYELALFRENTELDCRTEETETEIPPRSARRQDDPPMQIRCAKGGTSAGRKEWKKRMRPEVHNYLTLSLEYSKAGLYEEALDILQASPEQSPLCFYYQGFLYGKLGQEACAKDCCLRAEEANSDCCFPNRTEEIAILEYAVKILGKAPMAHYYLGNLLYDKKQYADAVRHWEMTVKEKEEFAAAHRNLAIAYYNKGVADNGEAASHADSLREGRILGDAKNSAALQEMKRACELDPQYPRLWLEYDQLAAKIRLSVRERLQTLEGHRELLEKRDDLYLRWITLLNCEGNYQEALDALLSHPFHPWEGGEGKVSGQYRYALIQLAIRCLKAGQPEKALKHLEASLTYPVVLGEGKLPNVPDNQAHYYMGLAYQMMGNTEQAREYLEQAAGGAQEPEPVLYYNDQPSDFIFYQGLANRELGRENAAKKAFHRLISYGEAHVFDAVEYDFFAVSLPEIEIFAENPEKRNRLYCNYLRALGSIGLGEKKKAAGLLEEILSEQPDYQGALAHLKMVNNE